jgi:hypothetical protein
VYRLTFLLFPKGIAVVVVADIVVAHFLLARSVLDIARILALKHLCAAVAQLKVMNKVANL